MGTMQHSLSRGGFDRTTLRPGQKGTLAYKGLSMIKIILGFKRRQGMTLEQFKDYRRDVHAPLLFAIPEAEKIVRFVVNYAVPMPDTPEPTFDAFVEAWFNDLDDLNELYTCKNFRDKVDPDHVNFIDLSSVSRVVVEELVIIE
jgi:hypothetical protein